jgi:hypothetical protein
VVTIYVEYTYNACHSYMVYHFLLRRARLTRGVSVLVVVVAVRVRLAGSRAAFTRLVGPVAAVVVVFFALRGVLLVDMACVGRDVVDASLS